ncbi:MAG TPA: hypothetical protein VGX68_10975 [Thermoanaerobaculia bacterium]|jgi:hypothetical protein|nr:hypothetical protein [Thermoanaerobaculia bacterium]
MKRALFRSAAAVAVLLALAVSSPALAGDNVIHKGVDIWMTVAGFAKTSFANEPIPAGFFCADSQPFTGTVVFEGGPLTIEPAGSLGSVDTVVNRLDDAVFNDKGEATTRIQLMALSLVSTKSIETSCGKYDVAVSLVGEQPTTTMRIVRNDAFGGTYTAPLALNVKAVFTPADGDKAGRRELTRRIDLGPSNNSVWTYINVPRYKGAVRIDTNGDGRPDAALPQASNFLAGVAPAVLKGDYKATLMKAATTITCPPGQCPYRACHCAALDTNPSWNQSSTGCAEDHLHCIWTCAPADAVSPDGADVACAAVLEESF